MRIDLSTDGDNCVSSTEHSLFDGQVLLATFRAPVSVLVPIGSIFYPVDYAHCQAGVLGTVSVILVSLDAGRTMVGRRIHKTWSLIVTTGFITHARRETTNILRLRKLTES